MTLQAVLSAAVLLIDIFFVARLGTAAVTAVGWVAALLALFIVLVNGVGVAVTTLVATAIASDDPAKARSAVGQALVAALALSVVIPLVAWPCYEPFLKAFGAPEETIVLGRPYAAWIIWGSPSLIGLFVINCLLRGAGKPGIALRALVVACLANIVLNPLLIFGLGPVPGFGLAGAGAAAVLGRLAGLLYQATKLAGPRRDAVVAVTFADLWVRPAAFHRLLAMSAGATVQSVIALLSSLFVLRLTAFYGEAAVAGYVIATRVVGFVVLPIHGIAAAVSVLTGQHVPAGRRRRADAVVHLAVQASLALTLVLTLLFLCFAGQIMDWFAADAEATCHAVRYLVIMALFFAPYAVGTILTNAVNGVGRMHDVARAYAIAYLIFQVPLAFTLALGLGLEATGVWTAAALAQVGLVLTSVPLARRHVSRRLLTPVAYLKDTGLRRWLGAKR
jgi:putative MATE family efflux protein